MFDDLRLPTANVFYSLLGLRKGYLDSCYGEDMRPPIPEASLSERGDGLGIGVGVVARESSPVREMRSSLADGLERPHEGISRRRCDLTASTIFMQPSASARWDSANQICSSTVLHTQIFLR